MSITYAQSNNELRLPATRAKLKQIRLQLSPGWPSLTKDEWGAHIVELAARLCAEAGQRVFFQIDPNDQEYVIDEANSYPLLAIRLAFPSAGRHLVHASRCYAFGEATASVFHSMRAAEDAVRALGLHLGIPWNEKQIQYREFGAVLKAIGEKVDAFRNDSAISREETTPQVEFCQIAAFQLERAKDGWRTAVAHRKQYNHEQAKQILEAIKDLFGHLAVGGLRESDRQD